MQEGPGGGLGMNFRCNLSLQLKHTFSVKIVASVRLFLINLRSEAMNTPIWEHELTSAKMFLRVILSDFQAIFLKNWVN